MIGSKIKGTAITVGDEIANVSKIVGSKIKDFFGKIKDFFHNLFHHKASKQTSDELYLIIAGVGILLLILFELLRALL